MGLFHSYRDEYAPSGLRTSRAAWPTSPGLFGEVFAALVSGGGGYCPGTRVRGPYGDGFCLAGSDHPDTSPAESGEPERCKRLRYSADRSPAW